MHRKFLSFMLQAGVFLRHVGYDTGLLKVKKVPAVVVSIGNIVAGGVGKTPLVHFLARDISKNISTAILSRGYRSHAEHRTSATRVTGRETAEEVGDEPLWLAKQLPEVQVWVGKNRALSAEEAIASGAKVLILDDGFQHRRLHRDFEIVVVNGEQPTGTGRFLPEGDLRDFPSRLSKATMVVSMGGSGNVVFRRTTRVDLQGKKVAPFCAVANPERFLKQVSEAGGAWDSFLVKPDHAFFSPEELQMLYEKSEAEVLVCTEKDFVKLRQVEVPVMAIPLELQIQEGEEAWVALLNNIQAQVKDGRRISSHAS